MNGPDGTPTPSRAVAQNHRQACSRATSAGGKPTPGLEPGTPSLRGKSSCPPGSSQGRSRADRVDWAGLERTRLDIPRAPRTPPALDKQTRQITVPLIMPNRTTASGSVAHTWSTHSFTRPAPLASTPIPVGGSTTPGRVGSTRVLLSHHDPDRARRPRSGRLRRDRPYVAGWAKTARSRPSPSSPRSSTRWRNGSKPHLA